MQRKAVNMESVNRKCRKAFSKLNPDHADDEAEDENDEEAAMDQNA